MIAPLTVNQRLVSAFEQLRKIPYFSGAHGDSVDSTFFNKLRDMLGARKVSAEDWRKSAEFEEYRRRCARRVFDFPGCVEQPWLIDKPNGSQQWPDALVVHRGKGLPIEFKSSKQDLILWNSGLPQQNGIYVFNGNVPEPILQTTYFLGGAILSDQESQILRDAAQANKDQSETFNAALGAWASKWSLYARPMFNCGEKYLTCPDRSAREQAVLEYLASFEWDAPHGFNLHALAQPGSRSQAGFHSSS